MSGIKIEGKPLRLYDYEKVCGKFGEAFPEKFSLEQRVTVKNQGSISSCVACALCSVAEHIWNREMSEGYTYGMFRDERDKSQGMFVVKALEYARELGFVPYGEFGVLQEMPEIRELVKKFPELSERGKKYRISGYASLLYADKKKRDNAIKDALMKGKIGLVAASYDYFHEAHAIMLTGWDDEKDSYEFQNSWGKDWGTEGSGLIPKNEINEVYALFCENIKLPFEDVSEDRWSYKAIKNLYLSGLINGTSEKTFSPERPITREEVAAIIDRLCSLEEKNNGQIFKVLNELLEGKE